jgi:hypothetical protein
MDQAQSFQVPDKHVCTSMCPNGCQSLTNTHLPGGKMEPMGTEHQALEEG